MMDISWGLNQTVIWIPAKRDNDGELITSPSGAEEYLEPINIKARFEYRAHRVVTREGAEVISPSRCLCKERIMPGDIIVYGGQEWPVIDIKTATGLYEGDEAYRTAYTGGGTNG